MPIIYIYIDMILLTKIPNKHKLAGFTLIEVLIAMLILSVGLLGLAGFQASSVRNNTIAYNRSQATQLAYDIADRMRANVAESGKGAASIYDSNTMGPGSACGGYDLPSNKDNSCKACDTTAACLPVKMAENDLFEWNFAVENVLQGSTKDIDFAGSTFTISISWDENLDGNEDANFQMEFQL